MTRLLSYECRNVSDTVSVKIDSKSFAGLHDNMTMYPTLSSAGLELAPDSRTAIHVLISDLSSTSFSEISPDAFDAFARSTIMSVLQLHRSPSI